MPGCSAIRWLSQVHGTEVADVAASADGDPADAARLLTSRVSRPV